MHAGIANYRFPLKSAAGENVPGIPGACATCNFTYLVRGPWSMSPGSRFNLETLFPGIGIPIIKIRWSWDGSSYTSKRAYWYWNVPITTLWDYYSVPIVCGLSMCGEIDIPIGHDYMAYMDYTGLNICCLRKAVKLNHSLTLSLSCSQVSATHLKIGHL